MSVLTVKGVVYDENKIKIKYYIFDYRVESFKLIPML